MATVLKSFSIMGVDGYPVDIETDIIPGMPGVTIVGMGDTAIREAKERLQTAIVNAKYEFPNRKIVINLAPSDMKKSGSNFDLAMAVGLLKRAGQINIPGGKGLEKFAFIGELSLTSQLRPCSGVLPMAIAAKNSGIEKLIVPVQNFNEASLVKGITVIGLRSLNEVVDFLHGKSTDTENTSQNEKSSPQTVQDDFNEVRGQDSLIKYIQIAAAGGHNMLMTGAPGCGKSMIAKRIPTIMPGMAEEEALEVTKIYSVAGLLKERGRLITSRPFRSPHHNASTNSLIGGGNDAKPGEISLAHNGVLFLDEIAEFSKNTLNSLRQPMEDKIVTISRVRYTHRYPCNFMLVAAMNPCPCGYYGSERCKCTDYEILKYRQKLSGPIMDRIDIQKYVNQVNFLNLSSYSPGTSSAQLKQQVEFARDMQKKRYADFSGINCNAQMTPSLIKEHCSLDSESVKILEKAYDKYKYSARTYYKFLKIARTFADFEGCENIRKKDVVNALMSRDLEKEEYGMVVV
ncbi:magnesium chelatase family protein [Peptoclostridium litorale DSM 5388]|uniref:Mg chelatase, subunit ChlI n=1 Tax=Peptoclostridium litorale DSM 5388 TaxID=1121324 RepID=A0A069RCA6_PEPLI|nr:YifB family Mg chelatase-like AAA ATPase [Peptoclostridium litorale]KDR94636.1 Mg chelatase, subunit ChlI [Peptoclostridium litorale DSM 5388]SIO30501.1 magnesium chelatase family protein [Peptoclostridium litorale DSM 5388]